MNKIYTIISKSLFLLAVFFVSISIHAQDYARIEVELDSVSLNPGETYQLPTVANFYADSTSEENLVPIKWHTEPGYLGKVDKNGILTSRHAGEGQLFAKYKDFRDSVALTVLGTPKNDDDSDSTAVGEIDYPKVKVVPGSIRVVQGDSVELHAFYVDTAGVKTDTVFSWSVEPARLGIFPDSLASMFYSSEIGNGYIIATLGNLADTIKIGVIKTRKKYGHDKPGNTGNSNRGKQLTVLPGDTVVEVSSLPIQYSATYKTNGNKHQNAEMRWTVSNENIASIDSSGMLTLTGETGMAIVSAKYSNFKASVELLVIDSLADTDVNTISVRRVLPNGNELKARNFKEGDSYKIGGLPFPLNALNGGMLHFPFGCVSEDVVIYMFIPEEYASMDDDSVEVVFEEGVITGVKFSVKPKSSDTIVEPFYFNIPIELSMVFKHELLDSLGIAPENLDVFFAENTGFVKDGTDNVVVDTVKNKIYSSIEHFSTIVVRQKSAETYVNAFEKDTEEMLRVFPNPFASSTQVLYKLAENSEISLSVYNLYGQKVKELVNDEMPAGVHSALWNGTNESGAMSTNGIYFFRIVKNGTTSQVARVVLNR